MKAYNRLILWTLLTGLTVIAALNVYVSYRETAAPGKAYRVEINRIMDQVRRGERPEAIELDQNNYTYVSGLNWIGNEAGPGEVQRFFDGVGAGDRNEFMVKPVYAQQQLTGYLRFSYRMPGPDERIYWGMNLLLFTVFGTVLALLLYIRR